MPSPRHEPIALQIAQQISLDVLLPADALAQMQRDQEARERGELDPDELDWDDFDADGEAADLDTAGDADEPAASSPEEEASEAEHAEQERAQRRELAKEPPLPEDVRRFMWHFRALVRAAYNLIGGPQLERLSRLYDRIGQDFKPSGPPESPVYESYVVHHVLSDVPVGLSRETPYSVLARLIQEDPARAAYLELARSLADAHQDLYRVRAVQGTHAELERLRDRSVLSVRTISDFLQPEDRLLARLTSFEGVSYLADAPYLLQAPDDQWLAYLQRITERAAAAANAAAAARLERPAKLARLTPKQRARLRQQRQRAEQAQTAEAALLRHLKFGSSQRFWLEFIVEHYAGQRDGIAYLAGVPEGGTDEDVSSQSEDEGEPAAEP
jgi:hypothetical protein